MNKHLKSGKHLVYHITLCKECFSDDFINQKRFKQISFQGPNSHTLCVFPVPRIVESGICNNLEHIFQWIKTVKWPTLQEINISHLGKRKSSSKWTFQGICWFPGGYYISQAKFFSLNLSCADQNLGVAPNRSLLWTHLRYPKPPSIVPFRSQQLAIVSQPFT